MKRRFAALTCALTLCAGLALPAAAADFTDVPAGAWYESAVEEAVEQGWMTGVSDTLFSPQRHRHPLHRGHGAVADGGGAHPGVAGPFP